MHASHCALTVRDRHSVLCGTKVGAWVELWLLCGGYGLFTSCCLVSEIKSRFCLCYKEVEYENYLSKRVLHFDEHHLSETGQSLDVLELSS